MFTGIIEELTSVQKIQKMDHALQVTLMRPPSFDDIRVGDSIACNGVCLTVESFDAKSMVFTIGHETLQITQWNELDLKKRPIHLERSLKFGDRVHGHIVSGHVDGLSQVLKSEWVGDCLILQFSIPQNHRREVWKKSSVALDGVSLTVNRVEQDWLEVCLIPETLRKTHLGELATGDQVNFETDYYMKGLLKAQEVDNAYSSRAY